MGRCAGRTKTFQPCPSGHAHSTPRSGGSTYGLCGVVKQMRFSAKCRGGRSAVGRFWLQGGEMVVPDLEYSLVE